MPLRYDPILRAWAVMLIGAMALFATIGGGLWLLSASEPVYSQPPVATASLAPKRETVPHLADDSGKRLYLSPVESREAASEGLLPKGIKSIIETSGKLRYGQYKWDDKGVPPGKLRIRVNLDRQLMSVFIGPHEVGTTVIVYGANGKETPRGDLPILGKTRDYHSITYDAPMPYSLWLRSDGVAIHGSPVTRGHATNGCIGVPVDFAAKLFALAKKGDVVEVIGDAKAG